MSILRNNKESKTEKSTVHSYIIGTSTKGREPRYTEVEALDVDELIKSKEDKGNISYDDFVKVFAPHKTP